MTEQLARQGKQLKSLRKKEVLFDAILDSTNQLIKPLTKLPSQYKPSRKRDVDVEDMVLHISDSHMDRVVLPSSVQDIEAYNFPEAVNRAENLVNNFIKIKEQKLQNYAFPRLYILMYGDNTNGTIHDYESKSAFQNQFKNCFAISGVYSLMLRDIAPHFKEVIVICLPGNHGRNTTKKDYEDPHNSWDYMIYESTRLQCKELGNVHFKIPRAYSAIVNINGWNFFIEHGDDVKSWNGIPYYGIERKTRRVMSLHASRETFIHYFVYGHFHTPTMLTNLGKSETIINGAWYRTDPFSLSLGYYTEPAQWMHGVSPKKGITFRFKVELTGPQTKANRYRGVLQEK